MTKKELAAIHTGMERGAEIPMKIRMETRLSGLVIVYGASDDLVEFDGAIYDEVGAYGGNTIHVDNEGILPEFDSLVNAGIKSGFRDYFRREAKCRTIEALWEAEAGYSWTFRTDIPHATFEIVEDGAPFCRGIVFSISDIGAVS